MEVILNIIQYLWQAFSITLNIFFTLFLPIIISCIILNIIAEEQNKILYDIAGWNGLLITAWIGTPIHELSHAVAAILSGHKVVELKLFKPDPGCSSLGYMTHSFNADNFYQAIIGNSIIAIAPFFGGAVAIYLLMYLLLPEFSLYSSEAPQVHYITSENLLIWKSYLLFGKTTINFFNYLMAGIFNNTMISHWRFYIFIFLLFSIANHLSPSSADFKNFWQALAVILVFMTLLNIIILPLTKNSLTVINAASKYVLLTMPILLLAIFIGALGVTITYLLYLLTSIFRR